jgi:hypothetical protein
MKQKNVIGVNGVNEHKKGQFEPARVRKLNEKQFSSLGKARLYSKVLANAQYF